MAGITSFSRQSLVSGHFDLDDPSNQMGKVGRVRGCAARL